MHLRRAPFLTLVCVALWTLSLAPPLAATHDTYLVRIEPLQPTVHDEIKIYVTLFGHERLRVGAVWLDGTLNDIRARFYGSCPNCPIEQVTLVLPIGYLEAGTYHTFGHIFEVLPAPVEPIYGLDFAPTAPTEIDRVIANLSFDLAACQEVPTVVEVQKSFREINIDLQVPAPTEPCDGNERRLASRQVDLGPLPPVSTMVNVYNKVFAGTSESPPIRIPLLTRPLEVVSSQNVVELNDRFRVKIDWRTLQGETGAALPLPGSSKESALFAFFGRENWEVLVKVLDACELNGKYWVFLAAATDVEFTLNVTDTLNPDTPYVYRSPGGSPAPPLTDTAAFACNP